MLLLSSRSWAASDFECRDALINHGDLISALEEIKTSPNTSMELIAEEQDLDHSELGPEGNEVLGRLNQLMVGHADVKMALARAVQRAATGTKNPGRPIATFLLLGITGTGKSLTADALAEVINGDSDAKITIDCGEVQKDHEISKVTGSPAGYVGHGTTPPLITAKRIQTVTSRKYKVNVLLVDELEKGSPALQRLLLGVLEKGTMTTGKNETVDFSNTIVIMTSNLGQAEMQKILGEDRFGMGFRTPRGNPTSDRARVDMALDDAAQTAMTLNLAPEFRNRIDKTFVFKPHTLEESREVLNMSLASLQRKVFLDGSHAKIVFKLSPEAMDYLLKSKYEPEFGGRSLRRTVDHYVAEPLTNLLASKKLTTGDVVSVAVDTSQSGLTFRRVAQSLSAVELTGLYRRIYGSNVPSPTGTASQVMQQGETEYSPERFGEYLGRVDAIKDARIKLDLIRLYVRMAPKLTDSQFLELLTRIPSERKYGIANSEGLAKKLTEIGIGKWDKIPFEPLALNIYWYGMLRLESLSRENRWEMNSVIGPMINGTQEHLVLIKADPKLIHDISTFLRVLHTHVMNLPEPH